LNSTSAGVDEITVTLSLSGYDATWITATDGSQGVWLGIGWNSKLMPGTNVVVCYYNYTNTIADHFVCLDGKNNGYTGSVPYPDQSNISNVTTITNSISTSSGTSSFSVSFTRPLTPTS